MLHELSNAELTEALDTCASEPVHIPGTVQPFGALLAVNPKTGEIMYASENAGDFLGTDHESLLGRSLKEVVKEDVWHAVQNALSRPEARSQATFLGEYEIQGKSLSIQVFESDGKAIVEFENHKPTIFSGPEGLKTLRLFMENIEKCTDQKALFKLTTELLRHITGYHRVMVYRFDRDFNGEVLAEHCRSGMDSFLGLRFPHWDIPSQARALMKKLPLRIIENVAQEPVPLRPLTADLAPLDISLAATRGVSTVHMEYLRNMGVQGTMTLSVVVEGNLWGIISFHHEKPRAPAAALREVLINIGQVFSTKLQVLQQQERLTQVSRVDALKDEILSSKEGDADLKSFMSSVLKTLDADGVVIARNNVEKRLGQIPDDAVVKALKANAENKKAVQSFDALTLSFPEFGNACNGCAGALVFGPDDDHCLLVFRKEMEQEVSWAGNPEKKTEKVSNRLRLSPRGSFSTYLEQVSGKAKPWSEQDIYFASRIWSVINTIERRELIASLNRQQKIMINELNHRVRNILTLVRSVSMQARQSSYGSLDSYARSLEARIQALAASHELASTNIVAVVRVEELIQREFQPFVSTDNGRVEIIGIGNSLRAEIAPIFSLVVHELVTNAVKYGALKNDTGKVSIALTKTDKGLSMTWKESGGPPVKEPKELGFGSTLIKQAIPYELNGDSELNFLSGGVEAKLFLPEKLFDPKLFNLPGGERPVPVREYDTPAFDRAVGTANCLIVEDNFMIAKAMQDDLKSFGVNKSETAGDVETALDLLSVMTPTFAILDVNLGGGETSFPVAHKLLEKGVPFFFVTGYGENDQTPVVFKSAVKLTKPIPQEALKSSIADVLLK